MSQATLPCILLHSDLHLESGPFSLPSPPAESAVAVFAGDVCSGDAGPGTLRSLTALPAVYVAGNHEFWGGDYFERLDAIKAAAKTQGIHFLENQSVVIAGVRFLGATLWTDYGGGDAALMSYGLWHMRDHVKITAKQWWTEKNRARFVKQFGNHALERFEGNFNPLLAMDLHRKTKSWLKRELAKPFPGPTVIVTHHAPSFQSLLKAGVSEYALNKEAWVRRMNDDLNLTKVGSYASEILSDLRDEIHRAGVLLWCHGHLHQAMHYAVHGVQVATNPRGRVHAPLTKESAKAFALFGYGVSDADIERSQKAHQENPEQGDGWGYEKTRTFSLSESGYAVIQEAHEKALTKLQELKVELAALRPLVRSKRQAVADLAAYRSDTLFAEAVKVTKEFLNNMSTQLGHRQLSRDDLSWSFCDCGLGRFNEYAGLENRGDYSSILMWKAIEEERTPEEREQFGYYPDRYSARGHLASQESAVSRLLTGLKKVPAACIKLRKDHLSSHRYFTGKDQKCY